MKSAKKLMKAVVKVEMATTEVVQPVAVKVQTPRLPRVVLELVNPVAEPASVADSFKNWQPEQIQFVAAANDERMGDREVGLGRLPAPMNDERAEAIVCTGAELCSVLAKLRRQGRSASEPVLDGPNRWLVYPGSGNEEFTPDLYRARIPSTRSTHSVKE